jgi:hypothetical protein
VRPLKSLVLFSLIGTAASLGAPALATTGPVGPTITFSLGIHQDALMTPDGAKHLLSLAVGLFDDAREQCQDTHVCMGLQISSSSVWSPSDVDADLSVSNLGYLGAILREYPTPQIKVVQSLTVGQTVYEGAALQDSLNAIIAVNGGWTGTVEEDGWAHEIGHMAGLHHKPNCSHLIMTSPATAQFRYAIAPAEADTVTDFLYGNSSGETMCDATMAAGYESQSATTGSNGVEVSFATLWEVDTSSFEVERVDTTSGTALYSVGTPALQESGPGKHYTIVDPSGVAGALYRIVEHQEGGRGDLFSAPLMAAEPPGPPGGAGYNADSLAAVVAGLVNESDCTIKPGDVCTNRVPCVYTIPDYEIICPDSLITPASAIGSLWGQRGVGAYAYKVSSVVACRGSIREWIRFAASMGTKYFLLMGDANDHAMWDDSTRWTNGWQFPAFWYGSPPHWCGHYPSQPEKDLIPTFYVAQADSPHVGWSHYTPYFATDMPYADVDDDSLPDVVVGRLPVSTVADANAYVAKLQTWLTTTGGALGTSATLLTFSANHEAVPALPTALGRGALRAAFPAYVSVTDTAYIDYTPVSAMSSWTSIALKGAADAAASGTDVIVFNLDAAGRDVYEGAWASYQAISDLPTTTRPFISVALSCDMNDFDRTEGGIPWYITPDCTVTVTGQADATWRPIVEQLLFSPTRGAIAQVGPTRASFAKANPLFGSEFLHRLYEPGSTVGRAFLLAQRTVMETFPAYRDFFKSYVLLGDPHLGSITITGVPEDVESAGRLQFLRPFPNPFNPTTRLRYYLPAKTKVELILFDVRGRVVRKLVDGQSRGPGWSSVTWDGRTQSGGEASSGVYFAVLRAGGQEAKQKLVILR